MQVAIIAGGKATRLGPLTSNLSKSMLSFKGKPFIEYQLRFLKSAGISEVVLCLGHLSEQIKDYCGNGTRYGLNLYYSVEQQPMDTAGALKLAENLLDEKFFTLYGDSYVFLDFKDMYRDFVRHNKLASMSVYRNLNSNNRSNLSIAGEMVIKYQKDSAENLQFIDYGVTLFKKETLNLIPPPRPYSMSLLFNQLIERNELLAYEVSQRFFEIGSIDGLKDFTAYVDTER